MFLHFVEKNAIIKDMNKLLERLSQVVEHI